MTVLPMPKPASPLVRARFALFALLLGLVLALAWVSDRVDPVTPASAHTTGAASADREPANPAENR
jgi:hypothetical protein